MRDEHYACVGGTDDDLAQHLTDVRSRCLALTPTAPGTTFRLDVDASGAVLGLTDGPDGTACAVAGWVGRAVLTVRPVELRVDRGAPWRSCLVADVCGADGRPVTRVGTALVDLAHSMHALRAGRDLRLRAAVLATYVRTAPTPEAWTAAEGSPVRAVGAVGVADDRPSGIDDPAAIVVTGVVRTAERRSSPRTGRGYVVAALDCGGLDLDVCWPEERLRALPRPGGVVSGVGRLVSLYAGPVTELVAVEGGPPGLAAESGLLDRDPPLALVPLPGGRPWSLPLPVVDLAGDAQVLAPLVSAAGTTDEGVVACCVDWDLKWQLRRFPPGSTTPDRVADLPGHAAFCVSHRTGVVVLVGRELVVLDSALRVLHRATFPSDGDVAVQAGPSAVHVLVSGPADAASLPDEAGRRAARSGLPVHRYGLHRLELQGPSAGTWRSMDLPVSGIHRLPSQSWPAWTRLGPADTAGEGVWFAVPTTDPSGRALQHAVAVSADGRLSQGPLRPGPPWTTASLVHGGHVLTADDAGPTVDGVRATWAGRTQWLTGQTPAVVVTDPPGLGTCLLEWDAAAGTPPLRMLALHPGHADVTRAFDAADGRRWYALSDWSSPTVVGVVDGEGPLHPVLRMRGNGRLLAVSGGSAVVNGLLPDAPVLDIQTGRLVPPGQAESGRTHFLLTSLVRVPLP